MLNLLDERKKIILKITVKDYIESAHPVSSRVLAKKYLLGWSPATIRNEMADLEEEGYLIQPHTSAGRIPSDRGYRFYVDFLLDGYELHEEDVKIANSIIFSVLDWESLLRKVAELMSERTSFIGVVLYPQLREATLKKIEFVDLREETVVIIVTTSTGVVKEKIIKLSTPITEDELQKVKLELNRKFGNKELQKIYWDLDRESKKLSIPSEIIKTLKDILKELIYAGKEEGVFVAGLSKILNHLEFQDINKVKTLVDVLEEEKTLSSLLFTAFLNKGLTILIGQEINIPELSDCSVITTIYSLGENITGSIGMIGPKRMKYERMLAFVELIGKTLSEKLTQILGE
ncbi:heat-inducible transcriptional repressor HrcA [Dictyoglomus thermophilum]|uniref:heat-inducible transcriptional repressor HrcA n=1 Tax=Dictyoglomus thermophilum TaxID=14 RepID=UPI001F0206A2|nr:heat-inducible transcriptional repressor HrcA [Dictyoglomus thermophilum]